MNRIFLLSPANSAGRRAQMLLRPEADFEVARRVQSGEARLGEVFAFLSGLYFRGKFGYARAFATPPANVAGVQVITAGRGLMSADDLVQISCLRSFSEVAIDRDEPRFTAPLCASAETLRQSCGSDCEVVLLGSIATGKYVNCLLPIFGEKLLFPADFVGRGDMSRGGLMLRSAKSGEELRYIPVAGALRRGVRPPKLPQLR